MNFFSISASTVKWLMYLWPPFWFTGIRFDHISDDFHHIRVSMPLRFYNKNFHGIQFGGSLYAMTDPCYLLMLLRNLGVDYRVLDKAAYVDYIKPGTSKVTADFKLTDEDLKEIIEKTATGEKFFKDFTIEIKDINGELVTKVVKTLYIRQKQKKS
ncbi:MAG: DUF4442 domain-containing protein [Cellvibrionaceae bacterium]